MNPPPQVYTLYGLRVHSDIPLPAAPGQDGAPPDLHIHWDGRKTMIVPPDGEMLSQLLLPNGQGYTLVDTGECYVLHFHNTGDFSITRDLRSVNVQLAQDAERAIAGLLLVGNIMACIFTLGGEPVLHASAVEIDGAAIAFLGSSGMGKSSLAGILCAHGANFITDDLLRLQPDGEFWRCYPGSGHLRLRQNAAASIDKFPPELREPTADGRVAIRLESNTVMPPLGAVIIPRLSRECRTLELERIPTAKALLYLMAFPRIQEFSRKEHRQRQLDFLGQVAARVPLYEATVPWGLPYPDELAPALMRIARNGTA